MRYPCRLAVALLGCAAMFNADARLQVSPQIPSQTPSQIPPHAPLHALRLPSLTVTLAPPAAADYAAMLDAAASGYQDDEPWRQPQGSAQQFDTLMAPAAFGQFGAGAGLATRQSGPAVQQLQSYTMPAPIPEPGHYHLMLIGMGLLCLYGGRRGAPAPWRLIRVGKKQHAPVMML